MKRRVFLLFGIVTVLLGACGQKQSPVEAVQAFMSAVGKFDVATVESLVCEQGRAGVRESLEPFRDASELGEAFDVRLDELLFQERSNDGQTAIVHVNGELVISFLGQQETQPIDEDHVVVKENGRWVVCDP